MQNDPVTGFAVAKVRGADWLVANDFPDEGVIATKRRKDSQKLNFELLAGQMDEDKVRKIEAER